MTNINGPMKTRITLPSVVSKMGTAKLRLCVLAAATHASMPKNGAAVPFSHGVHRNWRSDLAEPFKHGRHCAPSYPATHSHAPEIHAAFLPHFTI